MESRFQGYAYSGRSERRSPLPEYEKQRLGKRNHTALDRNPSTSFPESGRGKRKSQFRPRFREPCPVPGCTEDNSYFKVHSLNFHVPSIFCETHDPQLLARRRLKSLNFASSKVLGRRTATIYDLADHVIKIGLLDKEKNRELTGIQMIAAIELCKEMGIPPPTKFKLSPLSSPGLLTHWRVLVHIYALMEHKDRENFLSLFSSIEDEQDNIQYPDGFDSHFYMDKCQSALKLSASSSLKQLCQISPPVARMVNVVGAVANYCDPMNYPSESTINSLVKEGTCVTIGAHPMLVQNMSADHMVRFVELCQHPHIVGIGKVGIDHTAAPNQWHLQYKLLDIALEHLRVRHVLVLHCQSMPDSTEGYYTLLYQLRCTVSKTQRIHLQCFTGNQLVVDHWLQAFPNTYFGFTKIVEDFDAEQTAALKNLHEGKILLETNSPFFEFPGYSSSTPSFIGMVADVVARVRGVDADDLLKVTTFNARKLYCK